MLLVFSKGYFFFGLFGASLFSYGNIYNSMGKDAVHLQISAPAEKCIMPFFLLQCPWFTLTFGKRKGWSKEIVKNGPMIPVHGAVQREVSHWGRYRATLLECTRVQKLADGTETTERLRMILSMDSADPSFSMSTFPNFVPYYDRFGNVADPAATLTLISNVSKDLSEILGKSKLNTDN